MKILLKAKALRSRAGRVLSGIAGPNRKDLMRSLERANARAQARSGVKMPKVIRSRQDVARTRQALGANYGKTRNSLKEDYERQIHRLALKQAIRVFCGSGEQAKKARRAFDKYFERSMEVEKSGKAYDYNDPKIFEAMTEAHKALGAVKVVPFTLMYNAKYRAIVKSLNRQGARKHAIIERMK